MKDVKETDCFNHHDCQKCNLATGRRQVVVGSGPTDANIMIIGEAPGKDEDEQGKPFVGRSGKLLDDMLIEAGLNRDEIYITNTVCCRPPNNRTPEEIEISICKFWLWKKIKAVRPKTIVTLGKTATALLLKDYITTHQRPYLRNENFYFTLGKYVGYNKSIFFPTVGSVEIYANYHPSYLLRCGKNSIQRTRAVRVFEKVLSGDY